MSYVFSICFDNAGKVDTSSSKVLGRAGPGLVKNLDGGPYIVNTGGGVLFKARQLQTLYDGLASLGDTEVVARPFGDGSGGIPTFSAWLQRWEREDKQSRNPVLGVGHLPGYGLAKRILHHFEGRYVLYLSLSSSKTGTRVALKPRNGDGGISGTDGMARTTCRYLSGCLKSEMSRPDMKAPTF